MSNPIGNPAVLLVSEAKIKSFTSINQNVSPADLQPHIFDAQMIELTNYLGQTYMDALYDGVRTDTLSVLDKHLLDNYVGPVLCNFGLYRALPWVWSKVYNKSMIKGTTENGETASISEMQFLQGQVLKTAQSYVHHMLLYLTQHAQQYPLWNNPNIKDGILPQKGPNYFNQLSIPDPRTYAIWQRSTRRGWGQYGNGDGPGLYYDCYDLPTSN